MADNSEIITLSEQLQQSIRQANGYTDEIINRAVAHGEKREVLEQRKTEAEERVNQRWSNLQELLNNSASLTPDELEALREVAELDSHYATIINPVLEEHEAKQTEAAQLLDSVLPEGSSLRSGNTSQTPVTTGLNSLIPGLDLSQIAAAAQPAAVAQSEAAPSETDQSAPAISEPVATDTVAPNAPSMNIEGLSGKTLYRGVPDPEAVRLLQQTLQTLGYDLGPHGVDGKYGKDTQEAVRAFQQEMNINPDGAFGPETYGALQQIIARQQAETAIAPAETAVVPDPNTTGVTPPPATPQPPLQEIPGVQTYLQ